MTITKTLRQKVLSYRPGVQPWNGEVFHLVEQKLNGWRMTVIKENNRVTVHGRTISSIDGDRLKLNTRLWPMFEALPNGTVLDGELYVPKEPSSSIPRGLKFPMADELRFTPFAVPWFSGEDLRDSLVSQQPSRIMACNFDPPTQLTNFEWGASTTIKRQHLVSLASKLGIAGFILKLDTWRNWYYVKPMRRANLYVFDWTLDVTGGGVVSLVVAANTITARMSVVADVHGMTLAERDEMTALCNSGNLRGRICEIEYGKVGKHGRLISPRFVRWRDTDEVTTVKGLR